MMATRLDNTTLIQHNNSIGVPQGGHSMTNQDGCFITAEPLQSPQNMLFRFGIYSTKTVIQNQNFSVSDESSRERRALLLSAA